MQRRKISKNVYINCVIFAGFSGGSCGSRPFGTAACVRTRGRVLRAVRHPGRTERPVLQAAHVGRPLDPLLAQRLLPAHRRLRQQNRPHRPPR